MHPPHEINIEIIKPHEKVYTCVDLTHRAPQLTHSLPQTLLLYILSPVLVFPLRDAYPFLLEEPSCRVASLSP